jgi:hypothetical protein
MAAEIDCDRLFSGKQKNRMLYSVVFPPHNFSERDESGKILQRREGKVFNVLTDKNLE